MVSFSTYFITKFINKTSKNFDFSQTLVEVGEFIINEFAKIHFTLFSIVRSQNHFRLTTSAAQHHLMVPIGDT